MIGYFMTTYNFHSDIQTLGSFRSNWTDTEIKNEPSLFNCSFDYAMLHGGPITKEFLSNIPESYKCPQLIIDSRVHMLMPGWYPAIPGWHHDDVARSGPNNQPNYDKQPYFAKHLLGLVNAHLAPTKFAVGSHELPKPESTQKTYSVWHDLVEKQIKNNVLYELSVDSGQIVGFDWQTMHRCQAAVASGWRWFIRCTIREHAHSNEIRQQVNVYIDTQKLTDGW